MGWRPRLALWLCCAAVYLCFAPGRILYPDDEIVFQTTRALWERGDLAIEGIPKRTGEPPDRPDGTFGWATGVDGRRYGFFGHGLSVVALPLHGLGRAAITQAPPAWRHMIRSDHYFMHRRSPTEDWPRLTTSLTNCFITALAALLLVEWLRALGHRDRVAMLTGLLYAFGTSAWPYSGTFLSEPLSAVVLLASAWGVARYHRLRQLGQHRVARRWLAMAGAVAGASVHVHVLNLLAIPCLLGYAVVPIHRERAWSCQRTSVSIAVALGCVGPVLLGVTQALRFGSPWETGRYDHYGYFVDPLPGLVGQLVGPGRSILLYSPALIVGLWGWRRALTRRRAAALMVLAVFVARWIFVSTRSDWWGGWGIGPRYLVPVIPLLMLPLCEVLEDLRPTPGRPLGRRHLAVAAALLACVAIEAHLSLHSIFEWMLRLTTTGTPRMDYLTRSHWIPSTSPLVGFFSLPPDVLVVQTWRLAQHGHPGPWRIALGIIGVGMTAALMLVWWWRSPSPSTTEPPARPDPA
ncbi:hypothetical protein [Paraliomyxa miuraensis]|uniref:hypothetical protein n=1 Tax=Paraliomyxa miuraensis TaxID=376150 RepID=UPI00225B9E73|nr:hypothetical protein [Paraliomyxa miuraensis]MCX4244819.1 hypothetical protein [Paraliomyxa miuraensis]